MTFMQQFEALTANKPPGRQWVSRAQYVRYFSLAAALVDPDNDARNETDLAALLEVVHRPRPITADVTPHASSQCIVCVIYVHHEELP